LQYHIGCSGWSYTSWQGPFYPQNLTNSGWLNLGFEPILSLAVCQL